MFRFLIPLWLAAMTACGETHATTLPDDPDATLAVDGSGRDSGTSDSQTPSDSSTPEDTSRPVDSGSEPDADPPIDGGPTQCGPALCTGNQVCCNASCGICTGPDEDCPDIECIDAGTNCVSCPAPPPNCRYDGGSCETCGQLVCEEFCGGFAGFTCPDNQYCDYDQGCGFADGTGNCRPRPEVCQDDCPGVCGCDGQEYCNACVAAAAGVDVLRDGACDSTTPPNRLCGTIAGLTCPASQWCDYGGCATPDAAGQCQRRPQGCERIFDPVCGCDGETYANECEAQRAGVNIAHRERCTGNNM